MEPYAKHELDKIEEYRKKGYTSNYQIKDSHLVCLESDKSYDKTEVTIIDEYRYEGMSNPSDLSILYILETKDGGKGTILLPYGPSGDGELGWFMKEVTLDMECRS